MVTLGLSNYGSFLFTILFKSAAYGLIVDKLVMHPCVPFIVVHPQYFLVHSKGLNQYSSTGVHGAIAERKYRSAIAPCTPVEEYWFRPLCKVQGFVIDCIVLYSQI